MTTIKNNRGFMICIVINYPQDIPGTTYHFYYVQVYSQTNMRPALEVYNIHLQILLYYDKKN